MNVKLTTILIAGAIVAMSATPLWASSDSAKEGSDKATRSELGQPARAEEQTIGATSGAVVDTHATTSEFRGDYQVGWLFRHGCPQYPDAPGRTDAGGERIAEERQQGPD